LESVTEEVLEKVLAKVALVKKRPLVDTEQVDGESAPGRSQPSLAKKRPPADTERVAGESAEISHHLPRNVLHF